VKLDYLGKGMWKTLERVEAAGIEVNEGFITDLASTPKFLWWIVPPFGKYIKAAVIHDYLYTNGIGTKERADYLFLDIMLKAEVPKWKAHAMYKAVKYFGSGSFKELEE